MSSPSQSLSPQARYASPQRAPQVRPIYDFDSPAEFARRHKAGTKNEFEADQKSVYALNKKNTAFTAWVLSRLRQTNKRAEYLFIVKADEEVRLPTIGEICRLRIALEDGSTSRFWEAHRVEWPSGIEGVTNTTGGKVAVFVVTISKSDTFEDLAPLIAPAAPFEDGNSIDGTATPTSSSDTSHYDDTLHEPAINMQLKKENAVKVNFLLIPSEATKDSELGALELLYGPHANCTERQEKAFEYFVTLRNPDFYVNLYKLLPHMHKTVADPNFRKTKLGEMFSALNHQQRDAFLQGFANLPCGICVLPGGPGAGKTHFNLFTIAMAQLSPITRYRHAQNQDANPSAKVLFIVDMNSPVDDVANRMVRLYHDLGMNKQVIRMKGWGAEVKMSSKLNEAEDAKAGGDEMMHVDFTNSFIQLMRTMTLGLGLNSNRTCQAPTLDEAAWDRFERLKKTKYQALAEFLETELWENEEVIPFRFRRLVYNLYSDTLAAADFIATTPVAAHNHFKGMFRPDLVYFDESPHARELCNLIAIANFDPMAWIFCGDYRQTVPFVGSGENEFADQMRVSMMERAARCQGIIQHELLINHRSFGGLHQLASFLWYGERMTSGTPDNTVPLVRGKPVDVPRLVVHLKDCPRPQKDGTSFWNPAHAAWVMDRVKELLVDPKFLQPRRKELGTILIIAPYKKAFEHYKKEVKKLPTWARKRVEARTVDVVQGHEADFIFLDLVRGSSNAFLDNANRLCVAITRARLGEIIMMHPNMPKDSHFRFRAHYINRMYEKCKYAGQVVTIPTESGDEDSTPVTVMLKEDCPTVADFTEDDIQVVDGIYTSLDGRHGIHSVVPTCSSPAGSDDEDENDDSSDDDTEGPIALPANLTSDALKRVSAYLEQKKRG
ncbi:P-loop containing nucleoside triphosphate hydrolase protein [Podospora fimiseda]|uniref:P-loop containing nucleoside triphosphate hydrolase protein n=1 Tax=Podospora fimiseda TaxID=252190 RepID=A0AAN7BPD4_9PEZI|nr:P-loop containing nucleoside triphosphate hydrolase protein [Podospora fimiseda]